MSGPTLSYEKLNYTIRPSKQVERKLFIETLHLLGQHAGYQIRGYTYLGLGSVFYADFILFHKHLYIDNMICIEGSDIPNRMDFNKPYEFIELKMGMVCDVLPRIDFEQKYIVWLDYDYGLNASVLEDLDSFARKLRQGSILIVTVEAEPRLRDREENDQLARREREERLLELYTDDFGMLLESSIRKSDLSKNSLPVLFVKTIRSQLETSLAKRVDNVSFLQLFNFRYADGAQMVTLGGILGNEAQKKNLEGAGVYDLSFVEQDVIPKAISVPPLTFREKESIDRQIERDIKVKDIKLKFELKESLLKNYLEYYRHYPTFHEVVM